MNNKGFEVKMLQSFAQSQDWLYSEPLLFDEEFGESLIKDLQLLPTPPQSPPIKAGLGSKPLSAEDQLSYVSDILLEDTDMQLHWSGDFFPEDNAEKETGEDCLWKFLGGDKNLEEKLLCSVLGSSPLLSEIDTRIFDDIAGSTLDCHAAGVESQDHLETLDPSESTSDYGSAGGEFSTYSSSDSEEEIDVVTVGRSSSSPAPPPLADLSACRQKRREEEQREQKRHHLEIHLQHNYAAPCPPSPPPASSTKRSRGSDSSLRIHHSSRSSSASSSPRRYHHHHPSSSRHSVETEDEEERRRTHNVMERQRRNELKNCFVRLRDNVPELSHNDKASKVVILKKARDSIRGLEVEGRRLQAKRDKLRDRQEHLKALLQQIRS